MKRIGLAVAIALAVAAVAVMKPAEMPSPVQEAHAATPNIGGGGQVMTFPFHVTGTMTTAVTGSIKFAMPQPCDLIGAGASARIASGTLTTDILVSGSTIMSSAIGINTSSTWTEGTIGTPAIADEAIVSVNLTPAGGTPTFTDVTVVLTCSRR